MQPGLLIFVVIAVTLAITPVAVTLTSGPHPDKTHFPHKYQRNVCYAVRKRTLRTLGFFLIAAHPLAPLLTHKKSDNLRRILSQILSMKSTFNYKHLYYFWVVAKEGGITRAADKLDMAVQTVSAQVRELEKSLGYALLKPAGRGWS